MRQAMYAVRSMRTSCVRAAWKKTATLLVMLTLAVAAVPAPASAQVGTGRLWVILAYPGCSVTSPTVFEAIGPVYRQWSCWGGSSMSLPPGVYTITASHPYHLQERATGVQIVAGADTEVQFSLLQSGTRAGLLQGTVTNASTGAPIPSARVDAATIAPGVWPSQRTARTPTRTATGAYRTNVATGAFPSTSAPYTVTASAAGYVSQTLNVSVPYAGTATLNFALSPVPQTGALQGTVNNSSTGVAIGGATVQATGPTNRSANTNAAGQYSLPNLPPGTYSVTASASGYQSQTVPGVVINAGQTMTQNFTLASVLPDLTISKSGAPDPVMAGGELTYTLTVLNIGSAGASNVLVLDTLPLEVTFVSTSPGCTYAALDGTVSCTIPNLAAGGYAIFSISVQAPTTPGTIVNTAVVDPYDTIPESNETNNTATRTTTVSPAPLPDLTIEKTGSPDPVVVGDTLTYALTVRNIGTAGANNVLVMDWLPLEVTFVSASPGCTYTALDATVSCTIPNLTAGASANFNITVQAPTTPGPITNQADVDPNDTIPESNEFNNTAIATTTVVDVGGVRPSR